MPLVEWRLFSWFGNGRKPDVLLCFINAAMQSIISKFGRCKRTILFHSCLRAPFVANSHYYQIYTVTLTRRGLVCYCLHLLPARAPTRDSICRLVHTMARNFTLVGRFGGTCNGQISGSKWSLSNRCCKKKQSCLSDNNLCVWYDHRSFMGEIGNAPSRVTQEL